MRNTANIITLFRIIGSIVLIFLSFPSYGFFLLYSICGISDIADGIVARQANSISAFGSKLDTVADFVFFAVCIFKIIFSYPIPMWVIIWTAVIAVIKFVNTVWGFMIKKNFVVQHTILNKVAGFLLFLFPLTLSFIDIKYPAIIVCSVATLAAVQEGHYIRTGKEIT